MYDGCVKTPKERRDILCRIQKGDHVVLEYSKYSDFKHYKYFGVVDEITINKNELCLRPYFEKVGTSSATKEPRGVFYFFDMVTVIPKEDFESVIAVAMLL
jgi:hypothetical protein